MPQQAPPIDLGSMPIPNLSTMGLQGVIIDMMAADASREWTGQDLVDASGGRLKIGSIYVTLQRMQEKGLLSSRRELPEEDCAVVRRLYKLTEKSLALCSPLQLQNVPLVVSP